MASNPRIEELRKRLEKDPGSRLFAQLAEELRKDGELEDAIRVCREGLQKHSAYPSARMTLGRALMDTGDVAAARLEFEAVLKGAADNILASRFLGECLEAQGDQAGAITQYKITLNLAPGDKQVQARLQNLEARAAAPAPAAAVVAEVARVEPEPPPIPLAQVADESFELERPYEAPPGGSAPALAATPAPAAIAPQSGDEASPPPQPEPAAIPLVAADESFELERPWEAPSASTMPFRSRPLYEASGAAPAFEAAPPAPPALAAAPAAPGEAGEIASPTLAELYFNQGFTEKAIDVYRQLLAREPANDRARARLKELEALERHLRGDVPQPVVAPSAAPVDPRVARRRALERTIERLEGLRAALRRE